MRIEVEPTHRLFGKAQPCACRLTASVSEDNFALRAHIPLGFRDYRFESFLPTNSTPRLRAQSFVAGWPPQLPFLILTGDTGLGKTHLAVGCLWRLREMHHLTGQFWPVVSLLDTFKATYSENAVESFDDVLQRVRRQPLLVLDDFGAHKATDWADERLFDLIDERYRDRKPLVLTTNLTLQEMPRRLASRVQDPAVATVVQFKGEDRRLR